MQNALLLPADAVAYQIRGGPRLDLDAAYGIRIDTGVDLWIDRSGYGNSPTNTTDANQPAYVASDPHFKGRPSLTFDGSNDSLVKLSAPFAALIDGTATSAPWTIVVVYRRQTKPTAAHTFLSFGRDADASPDPRLLFKYIINGTVGRAAIVTTNDAATTATASAIEVLDQGPVILISRSDGATSRMAVVGCGGGNGRGIGGNIRNDMLTTTVTGSYSGDFSFDKFGVGCLVRQSTNTEFWAGSIARIMAWPFSLNDSEVTQLASWLANQYLPDYSTPASIPGISHHWDASLVSTAVGSAVSTLAASIGGLDFTGSLTARPTCRLDESGNKYLEFDGSNDTMVAGAVSDWKFLHDGVAQNSVGIVYRIRDENRDALEPLLDTVNDDTANNTGLGLYYDNRSSVPAVWRLRAKVGDTSATPILNLVSADNQARSQEWSLAVLNFDNFDPSVLTGEENFRLFLDGQLVAEADKAGTPDTGNATATLTLGSLAGGVTFGKIDVAEIFLWNARCISNYEQRKLGEYVQQKWNSGHVALMAGNGIANQFNDATPTRGYPGGCFDANGTMHVGYRRAADDGTSVGKGVIVTSVDGLRFSPERVLFDATGEDHAFNGPQVRMAVAPYTGRLVAVWGIGRSAGNSGPGQMRCSYSDDNGGTWATPIVMNGNDIGDTGGFELTSYGHHATIELPTGRLLTFYNADKASGTDHIVMMQSDDGGATWTGNGAGKSLSIHNDAGYASLYPSVVRYPSDGLLQVYFRENTGKRCMMLESDDDGATWSAATEMFTDANSYHGVVLDADERIYNFYRKNTGDRAVWRYSDDRGTTWSTERFMDNRSDYGQFGWGVPFKDDAGNIWLVYSMVAGNDVDCFCRLWRAA